MGTSEGEEGPPVATRCAHGKSQRPRSIGAEAERKRERERPCLPSSSRFYVGGTGQGVMRTE